MTDLEVRHDLQNLKIQHAIMERELSAANDQIDRLNAEVRRLRPPDAQEPITRDWLASIGFSPIPSDMGPTYDDHMERGDVRLWEYHGECWLWSSCDHVEMKTKGHLYKMLAWLGAGEPQKGNRPCS